LRQSPIEAPVRSRQRIRTYAAAAGMLFLAAPLRAQNAPCLRRSVVANVVDEKGNPVPGLTAADFAGRFHGKPVKILSATFDQQPRRIVILLDTSDSMRSFYLFTSDLFSATINELRSVAPTGSALAVATFSDKFQERLGFSSNWEEIEKQLAAIRTELRPAGPWKGRKVMRDSLLGGVALFGSPRQGDTIVLFSDGRDVDSQTDYHHVQRALWSSGVRLLSLLRHRTRFTPGSRQAEIAN
jgi:uncharacterized protein with von Willebrand factor type A (vWA) domain